MVPIVLPQTRTGFVTGPVPFAITNVGVTTITITSLSLVAPAVITDFDPVVVPGRAKAAPACPGATLPVGASCVVNFWFAPTIVGPYSGTYTVTFSGGTASPAWSWPPMGAGNW